MRSERLISIVSPSHVGRRDLLTVSRVLICVLGDNTLNEGKTCARIALTWSTDIRWGASLSLGILPILLHLWIHTGRCWERGDR